MTKSVARQALIWSRPLSMEWKEAMKFYKNPMTYSEYQESIKHIVPVSFINEPRKIKKKLKKDCPPLAR